MPQMLAIQPATPKAPPQALSPGTPGKKEQNQFSPHLDNALSSKKTQHAAANDKGSKNKSSSTDEPEQKSLDTSANESLMPNQDLPKSNDIEDYLDTTSAQTLAGAPQESLEQAVPPSLATDPALPYAVSLFSRNQQSVTSKNLLQNPSTESTNKHNISGGALGNLEILTEKSDDNIAAFKVQPELPTTTTPLVLKVTYPMAGNRQDALISQLQQIIDNSNETGTVSITNAGNSSIANAIGRSIHGITTASFSNNSEPIIVATPPESSELNLTGLLVGDMDGIEKSSGKTTQQLTGTRHDIQQQYNNAKINTENLAENQKNFGESQQGDELSQKTAGSSLQNGPLGVAEQTNTFSQISAIVQNTPAPPANDSVKPIILPSGTMVHENEVLQQLTERLQISSRQMDSRINLKLHPVELGELKINLLVKDGSIRANVVAQSQHTLEILEKNIPKLKTALENQGFTVDQISVTAESDSVGGFDLFDRQLFSHNDNAPAPQKGRRMDEDAFVLEGNEYLASTTSTGINVKI